MGDRTETNSLKEQLRNILEEARMILPGIQALFGFQTIAVFNQRFETLSEASKYCFLFAAALIVMSIALVMAPAAWHRLVDPTHASEETVSFSSRLISRVLVPLALAIALDTYVILEVVAVAAQAVNILASILVLLLLLSLWVGMPLWRRAQRSQ
jgi:hypothetical protein